MTLEEWAQLAARIGLSWSEPELTEERSAVYYEKLAPYPVEQVEQVFDELLLDDREFLPSLSVVLSQVEEIDRPGLRFEPAWAAIRASLYTDYPERFLQPEPELYLHFYRDQGGRQALQYVDETNSYQMARLNKRWDELVAEWRAGQVKTTARIAREGRHDLATGQTGGLRKIEGGKALPEGGDDSK